MLRNFNTIEDFKNADKTALLESLANDVRAILLASVFTADL
jgi:hypothetical protein